MYFVLLFCSFGGVNASAACTQTRYESQQACYNVGNNLLAMHRQSAAAGIRSASAKCVAIRAGAHLAKDH